MAILTTNAASASLFATAAKIRVRNVDGQVQIRPTDRKSPVNLPKTETLVDLRSKTATSFRANIVDEALEVGALYAIESAKYGWLKLVKTDAATGPAARVSAK